MGWRPMRQQAWPLGCSLIVGVSCEGGGMSEPGPARAPRASSTWEPDACDLLQPVIAAGRSELDFSDPAVLALLRRPAPRSGPVDGVTVSETTVADATGQHAIPVRVYRPERP